MARRLGVGLLTLVALVALGAPWLAPHAPERRFDRYLYAPPTALHVSGGSLFFHPSRAVSLLERRFEDDRTRVVPLVWLRGGVLVTGDPDADAPLLLFGADGYGRDIFSRVVHGSRVTLALAAVSTLVAIVCGVLLGGVAGFAGGWLDRGLSRVSELVLVLPAVYVALALRAALPLVLTTSQVFAVLVGIFGWLGWPIVARGVRAIVVSERAQDHVAAARALGASPSRVLLRHVLPATRGFVLAQAALLLPAFILAEATLSYVGLGFPAAMPTWGTLLQEASNVALLGDAPWALAPAAAIFVVVLAVNLAVQGTGRSLVQLTGRRPTEAPGRPRASA